MNSFRQSDQAALLKTIENGVLDALHKASPSDISTRIMGSSVEFSDLQPRGKKLMVRLEIQLQEKDKKESPG